METKFKNFREESKLIFGTYDDRSLTIDELSLGCILRIADAIEKSTQKYDQMERELKWHVDSRKSLVSENEKLRRQLAGYKGYLKRIKK